MRMNKDWKIGDELREELTSTNTIIVGIYKDHYEGIAFNGSDFDTFIVKTDSIDFRWIKTGRNFSQIAEMIKIMKNDEYHAYGRE